MINPNGQIVNSWLENNLIERIARKRPVGVKSKKTVGAHAVRDAFMNTGCFHLDPITGKVMLGMAPVGITNQAGARTPADGIFYHTQPQPSKTVE